MHDQPEKRRHQRHLFDYPQWMAPVYQGMLPSPWSFQKILCQNLSAGGMSFFQDEEPRFEECVIALAEPPELFYLFSKVVNVVPEKGGAPKRYRVGCQFMKRLCFDEERQCLRFRQPEESIAKPLY
jgi:hypothetical protein